MDSNEKQQVELLSKRLAILRTAFGPIVDEALDRAISFVEAHNSLESPLQFGILGQFVIVVPSGKSVKTESLLVIDLTKNNIVIDQFGFFGTSRTALNAWNDFKTSMQQMLGADIQQHEGPPPPEMPSNAELMKVGSNIGPKTSIEPAQHSSTLDEKKSIIPLYQGPHIAVDKTKLH